VHFRISEFIYLEYLSVVCELPPSFVGCK